MKKTKIVAVAATAAALSLTCFGCGNSATNSSSSSAQTTSGSAAEEQAAEASGFYVDVDWLKDNMGNVYIVDARGTSKYYASHIPGAVSVDWNNFSNTSVKEGEKGWASLLPAEELAQKLAQEGIGTDKPIVVYTNVNDGWGEDGRTAWTLQYAGYEDVHILDGGWGAWVGAGNETSDIIVSEPENTSGIKAVSTKYVQKAIKNGTATIVDARATAEYEGTTNMGEAKMGHIPGAVSLPSVSLYAKDGKLLSDGELDALFQEAGLTDKNAEIITYCTGGVRAANVAQVLKEKGYTNVKVYTTGFAEWAGAGNKVEK